MFPFILQESSNGANTNIAAGGNNAATLVLLTSGIAIATTGLAIATSKYLAGKKSDSNQAKELTKKNSRRVRATLISGLKNQRGSEGMGLPTSLSQKTIDVVAETAGVVAPEALNITTTFYGKMFGKHRELLAYFNPAHNVPASKQQPQALAASIVAYASNIKDLSPLVVPGGPVDAINHRHCALGVIPAQYPIVYENLMQAIELVLGKDALTKEVASAWSEAVLFLAKVCIDQEEALYQMAEQREGGWSGLHEFEVSSIEDVTNDVKRVTFRPPVGSDLQDSRFDFSSGQYLSLKIDPEGDGLTAPRHYTVTSPPGADYLQCSIKKIPGGKVSTYVHESLGVGDKVQLTAPFGVYTVPAQTKSAVLLSAGIGITPMLNLQRELGDKMKLAVHVDKNEQAHPYRAEFKSDRLLTKYSQREGGRTKPVDLVKEVLQKVGTQHTFFVCGPESWMHAVQESLLEQGAAQVMCEMFGSQLASACPFSAKGQTTEKKQSGGCPFLASK